MMKSTVAAIALVYCFVAVELLALDGAPVECGDHFPQREMDCKLDDVFCIAFDRNPA